MTQESFINILVAEDNEVSREMMAGVLRAQGYRVYGAIDGESAIKVVGDRPIDLAIVDINMAPKGGFEFVKHLVVRNMKIPVVMITGDESSHVLVEAASLGVAQVVQKPVDAEKLIQIAHRILTRRGLTPRALAVGATATKFSPEDLMKKAVAIADKNVQAKRGGPFGAVVADKDGKILGEGASGRAGRADPMAHAEVMAIRQAASRLGSADLSDCILYSSSEPTMVGQALIISVGIKTVYYGLKNEEVRSIGKSEQVAPEYIQIGRDEALAVFKNWQAGKEKAAG